MEADDIYLVPAQSYEAQRERGFIARKDSIPYPLTLPIDWGADPYADPNWHAKLQHWRMTDPILERYFATGERELLREAFDYAVDWHRWHFVEGREAAYSWRDGGTGIRALRIAFFLDRVASGELAVTDA